VRFSVKCVPSGISKIQIGNFVATLSDIKYPTLDTYSIDLPLADENDRTKSPIHPLLKRGDKMRADSGKGHVVDRIKITTSSPWSLKNTKGAYGLCKNEDTFELLISSEQMDVPQNLPI